ncbi:hypothetical protein [Ruficoccus sp. ZRK36]|uniref:hypothetical protein n=1 Tax=Ruficoccus sp. ZRK36 TaxID=2866311 RepID=UPI001C733C09|nr:hypothetical protein [Ruficoccus sp. ZRK36]QYY36863.1 hypothetical protein K0V07_05145 [Ruficoccus sp. ZRK36]
MHKLILRYDLDYPKFMPYLEFDSTGELKSEITRSKKEKELNKRELLLLELYFRLGACIRRQDQLHSDEVIRMAYLTGHICAEEERMRVSNNKFATIVPDDRYWFVRAMQMCWPMYLLATPTKRRPDPGSLRESEMKNLSDELREKVFEALHACRIHLTVQEARRGVRLTPEMICSNMPDGFRLGAKTVQRWQRRWATLMMSGDSGMRKRSHL